MGWPLVVENEYLKCYINHTSQYICEIFRLLFLYEPKHFLYEPKPKPRDFFSVHLNTLNIRAEI